MGYGYQFFVSIFTNGEILESTTCENYPTTFLCAYPTTVTYLLHETKVNYLSGVCHYVDNILNSQVMLGLWLTLMFALCLEAFLFCQRMIRNILSRRYLTGKHLLIIYIFPQKYHEMNDCRYTLASFHRVMVIQFSVQWINCTQCLYIEY